MPNRHYHTDAWFGLDAGDWWAPSAPPGPSPDLQGFTAAALASAATNAEKGYLLATLPALVGEMQLGALSLIENGWQAIENSGQPSAATMALGKELAVTYAIPIS